MFTENSPLGVTPLNCSLIIFSLLQLPPLSYKQYYKLMTQ